MNAIDVTKAVCVPMLGGSYLPATIMELLDVGCFAVSWKSTDGTWVVTTCDNDGQCKNGYVVQNVPEPAKPVPHTRETWPMYRYVRIRGFVAGGWFCIGDIRSDGIYFNNCLYQWNHLKNFEGSHDGKSWEPLHQIGGGK